MRISPLQLRDFHEDGYIIIRGAVAPVAVREGLRAINHSLGHEGIAFDDLPKFRAKSYCPNVQGTPAITNLFNQSPLLPLLDSMLGEGNTQQVSRGQIALRFPAAELQKKRTFGGHLDGIGTGTNGIEVGKFSRGFTALVTVLMHELPEPFAGNFTVWPGSHLVAERFFQEATPEVLRQGMPELQLTREPVQITGKAGDAVITHHQLVHGAAPNFSHNIRYAVIFRACHREVKQINTDAMTDIWREWDGVRNAMAASDKAAQSTYA